MNDRTKDVHEKISRDLRNIGLYLADHADDLHGHDGELIREGGLEIELVLEYGEIPIIRTSRDILVV